MHFCKNVLTFIIFLLENICCGYSLEVPHWGISNEYPQHMFHGEIRKILCGYPSYLEIFNDCQVLFQCKVRKNVIPLLPVSFYL